MVFFKAVSADIVCWRNAIEYLLSVRIWGEALSLSAHISIVV